MTVSSFIERVLGGNLPIGVEAYDGSSAGDATSPARLVVRSPRALRRFIHSPGELGLARAYVAGDVDFEGDLFALLAIQDRAEHIAVRPALLAEGARLAGRDAWRPLPPPPEEIRLGGRRHSSERDAAAIAHHYDLSNAFYRILLGPSMTYSCAVFNSSAESLEQAQANKHDLICRKLGLGSGARLLDVGCGWGSFAAYAATHYGVSAVGVTVSRRQYEYAQERIMAAGLGGRVEVQLKDYRDVTGGPFDAISSIGMFEHVGLAKTGLYMRKLHSLLTPGGRLLNHAISTPGTLPLTALQRFAARRSFIQRYVFPDGELLDVGRLVTMAQTEGLEARHIETLREHYALTLRRWLANLEAQWGEAVAEVGMGRARVWRLYLAGSAVSFEQHSIGVHQILAVNTPADGRSGLSLRPAWEQPKPFVHQR